MRYKDLFSKFLGAQPDRLHVAAHSHHLWPDVAYDAHCRSWLDAAELADHKWERIFTETVPQAQAHIARILGLADPSSIAFAPNTHELVGRLVSSLPSPARILTTDGEFHSFNRQCRRWQEAGRVSVERVALEPFASFEDRFLSAASEGSFHLIFTSQVFFNSGFVFERFAELAQVVRDDQSFVVIDGYHGFMALPTGLKAIADRVFYLAGGYKYAMSGEGACFMHCPPGYGARPVNTGWFAGFAALEGDANQVAYGKDGSRFLGSTFDPSGLYRFNAVQTMLQENQITPAVVHAHVGGLQERFLAGFDDQRHGGPMSLVPGPEFAERGHFLTFRTPRAKQLVDALAAENVVVDSRDDRLRFGLGLYHDDADIDELLTRLARIA